MSAAYAEPRAQDHDVQRRMEVVRARLERSSDDDPRLRVMLLLTHEVLRQRSIIEREPDAPTTLRSGRRIAGAAVAPDDYVELIARIRAIVERNVPRGARILVVSRGDEALLWSDFETSHFPQDPNGMYAGYYPADTDAAVSQLEACRAAGAEFLVLPSVGYWWLDFYEGLARHLLLKARVAHHDEQCAIFDLRVQEQGGEAA